MSATVPERGGMGNGAGGVSGEWRCHSSSPLISLGSSGGDAGIRPPSPTGDLAPGVRAHGCEVAGGGGRLPLPRLVVVTPDVQAPQSRAQVAVGRGARARG